MLLKQEAIDLIKQFEGFRAKPYLCSAGVPTIGYGSTFYENGNKVTLQDSPITEQKDQELLNLTLNQIFIPGVLRACPNLISYPNKLGAIVSFAYNLGVGRLQASTLRRKINAEDWEGAGAEILKWNLNLGKPSKGLTVRRKAEKKIGRAHV